jgi:hypothetical protein
LSQSSFADAGDTLDQQVPASNQGHNGQAKDVVFAPNDLAEGGFQLRRTMRNGTGGFRGHYWDSTMGVDGLRVTEVTEKAISFQLSALR